MKIITIILFTFSIILSAQNMSSTDSDQDIYISKNPRKNLKQGMKLSLLGSAVPIGFTYDYFVTSTLNIEVTLSIAPAIGVKLYPTGFLDYSLSFYFGAYTLFPVLGKSNDPILYFPLGIEYISSNGFTISGDFGVIGIIGGCCLSCTTTERIYMGWLGLKIGNRF